MSAATIQRNQIAPYQQPVDEVLATLGADERSGLSQGEARARLESYGRNELTAEKPSPGWKMFLAQFQGEVMTMFFGVLLANVIGLKAEGNAVVLPLLATQLLWINLVTDGAPALALGVDPADGELMNAPPRPRGESVITRRMWFGILFVGVVSAAGTLFALDASLPGGLIKGSGSMCYAQTMAFTTMVFFSIFTVFNARSDERSAFAGLFSNKWLWGAMLLSLLLQAAVIYIPFLQ